MKVLNETTSTREGYLAEQMETYRVMINGNITPDVIFEEDFSAPGYTPFNALDKLSDIRHKHNLIVFGASWRPKCAEELL